MGETAAHGKQMDEKRSTDVHGKGKERWFIISRKDQKIGSAISLPSYLCIRISDIAHKYLYKENAVTQ